MVVKCIIFILIFAVLSASAFPHQSNEVLTQPKPGEEYVFVQTSSSGARPIARKDHKAEERPFETSHKLPLSLTYLLNKDDDDDKHDIQKRAAPKSKKDDTPAPAPAGAIKLDIQKLLEKYKDEIKTSTTAAPKTTTTTKRAKRVRSKKEVNQKDAPAIVTSPSPILTTGASAPKAKLDDIPLVASGSEKQRSRIQIKKGPNGQEYEYEYVYYYYDDDDDKVSNSHDGPAKNQITQTSGKRPEVNEVVPSSSASSKSHSRGRQIAEDEIGEERLPANTRFPPRSRNLNTTPLPEEETKPQRGRGRGRSTTEPSTAENDNVSDETREGTRGRTRPNVRRPSLDLVDNASFNTHTNAARSEVSSSGSPAFPADLPAGPEPIKKIEDDPKNDISTDVPEDITTVMSPMDKVALDLYAILQGTQKLSGEDAESNTDENSTDSEATTIETTTELFIETTTPTTTTTTTTTTTQAPTTTKTTTIETPVGGRGKFKGRGRKTTTNSASTTEAATVSETKPKSKFNRPSFGGHRPRIGAKTTSEAPVEQEASKEEAKPVSHSRPTLSRSRFGGSRPRTRTTSAPEEAEESASSSTAAPARSSLTRNRPSFNLRTRGRTTAAPAEPESSNNKDTEVDQESTSTTARTRRIQSSNGVRPLRPGPRINLGRGRPGHSTTTEAAAAEENSSGNEENTSGSNASENSDENKDSEAPADSNPLNRLKNKHRVSAQAKPKASASASVQVRRVNPLLARRRPGQTTEAPSEVPQDSVSTEVSPEPEANEETEEAAVASSTTTEEPRGLNKLLAGRRRVTRPATHH